MVREGIKGKIVFVGSVLSYSSFVGYSTYSPGKFALRGISLWHRLFACHWFARRHIGLAEALQSEFILYGIDVHICCPATMFTAGYEEENKTKPRITSQIEEKDSGAQAEAVAISLLKGPCRFGTTTLSNWPSQFRSWERKLSHHIRFNRKRLPCVNQRLLSGKPWSARPNLELHRRGEGTFCLIDNECQDNILNSII